MRNATAPAFLGKKAAFLGNKAAQAYVVRGGGAVDVEGQLQFIQIRFKNTEKCVFLVKHPHFVV